MTDLESNDTNQDIPHNLEKEFIADKCSTPTKREHVYCVEGISILFKFVHDQNNYYVYFLPCRLTKGLDKGKTILNNYSTLIQKVKHEYKIVY